MRKTSLVSLVICFFACGAFAQCPDSTTQIPQLHGVVVKATVGQDTVTKILTYRFSVRDDNTSIGCITQFQVDITFPPGRDTLPSSGLVDYPRYVIRNLGTPTGIALIPIGVPSLPSYNSIPSAWLAIVSRRGFISWGSKFSEVEMPPGGQLSNLVLTSYGLPSIRSYTVKPKYNPPPVDEGEITEEAFDTLRMITNSIAQTGFTVGPTAQPAPFDSLKFLDTLKSYTVQARTLGWITNQDTANRYSTLFDSVKAQIQRGSGQKARITLDAVIANTIRDSSGAITSEAYALLRFNSAYLKGHLPKLVVSDSVMNSWNMVSVPVEPTDFRKSVLYSTATSPAYYYNNAYLVKDTLANGVGYWLKYPSAQLVGTTGLKIDYLRVPLVAGWNLIGTISYDVPLSNVKSEDTTSVLSTFYGYSGPTGYTSASTLKKDKAYWVKSSKADFLNINKVTGALGSTYPEPPPPEPGAPNAPILLSPDSGATGETLPPTLHWYASSTATSYDLRVATDAAFGWVVYDNPTITSTSAQVGGLYYSTTYYWKVTATNQFGTSLWSTKWSFTTQPAPPPPPCDCCIQSATQLDQFTVTDAAGKSQSMFVSNGGRGWAYGVPDPDMPPAPVPGLFHARFQSGKIIERVALGNTKSTIPIVLKDVTTPFTVSWNIKTENKIKYWLTDPVTGKVRQLLTGSGSAVMKGVGSGAIVIQAQASQPCQ